MKSGITISIVLLTCAIFFLGCKSKKEINDPTQLQVNVIAELKKGVAANKIQEDLSEFEISDIKRTNMTLNQYMYKVTLKGQSANELLKAFNSKDYIKSAIIAPMGGTKPENMPSGKSTKTKPING